MPDFFSSLNQAQVERNSIEKKTRDKTNSQTNQNGLFVLHTNFLAKQQQLLKMKKKTRIRRRCLCLFNVLILVCHTISDIVNYLKCDITANAKVNWRLKQSMCLENVRLFARFPQVIPGDGSLQSAHIQLVRIRSHSFTFCLYSPIVRWLLRSICLKPNQPAFNGSNRSRAKKM